MVFSQQDTDAQQDCRYQQQEYCDTYNQPHGCAHILQTTLIRLQRYYFFLEYARFEAKKTHGLPFCQLKAVWLDN